MWTWIPSSRQDLLRDWTGGVRERGIRTTPVSGVGSWVTAGSCNKGRMGRAQREGPGVLLGHTKSVLPLWSREVK